MKTKEELLKIYSAYLPYKLIVNHIDTDWYGQEEINTELIGIENRGLIFEDGADHFLGNSDVIIKPYLWSMDMLTNEIEHKGKRFNVVDEIRSIFPNAPMFDEYINYGYFKSIKLIDSKVEYCVVVKLIEMHFNVFGLSDSEYIKKENYKAVNFN